MQYDHADLVTDFARRTRQNLLHLRSTRAGGAQVYEVTQLINSMLGLLIFPHQRYVDAIPKTPLHVLAQQGWPIPVPVGGCRQAKDLRDLIRLLRNAIAHCNLAFQSNDAMEITGVQAWNVSRNGRTTWRADLSIQALEGLADKLLELLMQGGGRRLTSAEAV